MESRQMTIFDFLVDPGDPIRNAIKHMTPYWTSSKQTILDAYYSGRNFARTVKHEYSPYGHACHYGGDFGKKGIFTLHGWELKNNKVIFLFDPFKVESMTWEAFAEQIADLIQSGEFLKRGD